LIDSWQAFFLLSQSRPMGWSIGAIPLSEIAAYVGLFGAPAGDVELFVAQIRALDQEFLRWHRDREATAKAS
jgi:hypothetical protein